MHVHFISKSLFEWPVDDDDDDDTTVSRITSYFQVHPVVVTEGEAELDLAALIMEFNHNVD